VLRLGSAQNGEYHSLYLTIAPERVEGCRRLCRQTLRSTLQFESAFGKQLLDFHLSRRQSLLVGIFGDRVEHRCIGFDAVRKWIVAQHFLRHRQVFSAKKESRGNFVQELASEVFPPFYESVVQVEGGPRMLPIDVAADDIGMVDREKSVFLEKTRSLGHAVGKERLDDVPISAAAWY